MAYRPSDKSMPYEKPSDMPGVKKAKGKRGKKPMSPMGKGKRDM